MFGKRRRAASNPPQRAPPSTSASLAATKAFLRDKESNDALSSAAASAALRTHIATPTPVGDTVTKRMARRNSASSNGSNARPPAGPLRRQSSSGSMTERTFRSPSPGGASPADANAPPVPPLPKGIAQNGPVQRRASSLEPAFRAGSTAPRGAQNTDEDDATLRSVNFSRPMSPGIPAPKQNPSPQSGHGWFGGPVVNQEAVQRMASTTRPTKSQSVSGYDLQTTQQRVKSAADRPVKTHHVSHSVEGSRLASGSMRANPTGTAVQSRSFLQPATRQAPRPVDPNSPDAIYDPSTRTFIHKQDAMARHRELHQDPGQPPQQYVAQHVHDYHPHHVPPQQAGRRSPGPLRQSVQQQASPASQKSRDLVLPRLDTASRRSGPPERQATPYTPEPHVIAEWEGRNSEDFADADTQLPEQANTGRKPENTVDNAEVEHTENVALPKFAQNQESSYPRLATPVIPTPTNTVASQGHGSARTGHDRQSSLSPPRNAHFASMAVELAGEKHQPPPRSISPSKSALKSSPSVSRRGNSPVAPNGSVLSQRAPSEVSDTTSDDGLRKKRNVRVSFDETPVIAGSAAHTDAETPTIPVGLNASKWSPTAEKKDDFEDFMKPRAALPVFGSIRDKERRLTEDDIAEKVTETVSTTPMSGSVGSIGEPLHSSNDHALGSIVAQDFVRKQGAPHNSLPPEVTSVEGSGHVSDSSDESGYQKHDGAQRLLQSSHIPEPKSLTTPLDEKTSSSASASGRMIEVPQIALLPATPGPYERPEPEFHSTMLPGGWNEEAPEQAVHNVEPPPSSSKTVSSVPVVDPGRQQSASHAEQDDSADDDSSIYSDAYEDLSDTEGGFGSIDAMVGSRSSGLMYSRYADNSVTESPASGLRNETVADNYADSDATPTQDWDAARQHWSGLNTTRKQPQREVPPAERQSHAQDIAARVLQAPVHEDHKIVAEPVNTRSISSQAPQSSPKPLKSALKKHVVAQPIQPPEPQMKQATRGVAPRQGLASEPQMKKTMRGGTTPAARAEPQMRSSMRGGPDAAVQAQPHMRKSMRGADPAPSTNQGLAASRHSMVPTETKPPRGALQKRHIPAAAAAAKPRPQSMPAAKQAAAPAPTYDSDSDASTSSFQRARARGGRNQGGRYSMRGSMRGDTAPTMRATAPAPKPVRSISPPVSPSPAIRKSMRPSSPTPEPVKSSKFSIRSLSPMGRFRSSKVPDAGPPSPTQPKTMSMPAFSKQPKQKAPVTERGRAAKPPLRSRFANSSDEDNDDQPRRFQSRFADSDSDDADDYKLPPGLAPVRGIPRKSGEEDSDSTDLEEEAEHEKVATSSKPLAKAGTATNGVTNGPSIGNVNGQGAALSVGSLRDSKHAPGLPSFEAGGKAASKRGFFGMGKKQTTSTQSDAAQPTSAPDDILPPPSQRNRELGLPLTPIDEDKDIGTPVQTSAQSSPATKKAPKLHRRSTPEWPLPPPPTIGNDERPVSSDGIAPRRPHFGNRQPSTISNVTAPIVDAQGRSISYGKSGKKKKFQGLRRVFGLND